MLEGITPILIKGFLYLVLVGVPIFIVAAIYRDIKERRKIIWYSQMRFIVLRILVPKNNEKTPLAAEQMFAALHGIYRSEMSHQEYISLEIAARDKYLQFYVTVPTHLKEFVQGQIYAQYPTAEISEVDDYTLDETERISIGELKICGADLKLINKDVYPIKTFPNFEVDPLAGITGVLSRVEKNEQVWIQILIKPVSDEWQSKGIAHIEAVKSGHAGKGSIHLDILGALARGFGAIISTILTGATPPSSKAKPAEQEAKISGTEEAALKGIETKVTKLGFNTKIRILAMAPNENVARSKITSVVGAFKQYNVINLNGFQASLINTSIDYWKAFSQRMFLDEGQILNIEELASIFHLPSISVETPSIVWAGSKKGEPPADLPIEDNVPEEDLTIFAQTDFRHIVHKFGIKIPDRRYHMYAMGKTGTGKSTMLENMAIDDIREGRGLAVVDPHGDLINHVMDYIPEERIKDVVWFSPADRIFPVAFNPLETVDPDLKNIVASGVVGIFKKIFGESWGPRLEYILRNTILALLDYPNATMLGITRILVDQDFRNKVVSQITDPVIKDFFVNEFEQYDPKFRTEAIAPIQNKVGQFLSSSTIRNIVGQPKSTINLQEIMDKGKILLVNLSIGEIGEDASALLGALMITKIQLAAMQRAPIPEEERRDFYLYVDVFQNFATDSFAVILSEARKYRLNIIMTNQYIAQVPEEVIAAVFGNVGTLISFRIGAPDADILQKEFMPVFEAIDLVNLDNYHVYVKMSIDGVTCPAFSATTLPRSAQKLENREKIITFSRENYSRKREYVESQIESLSSLPKVEEILTKAEKKLIPRIPPKIGETYYREVQTPGDVRWYFGGGTIDQPLTEDTVQEKMRKVEEKAKEFGEKKEAETEKMAQWQQERLEDLETNTKPVDFTTQYRESKPAAQEQNRAQNQNEVEQDKKALWQSIQGSKEDHQPLEEGEIVKIDNKNNR